MMLVSADTSRVLIAASQQLVADTIQRAMVDEGFDVQCMLLTTTGGGVPSGSWRDVEDRDVGALVSDLATVGELRQARAVVGSVDVPWLLLTSAPAGAAWGAVLDAGAAAVMPMGSTLSDVCHSLYRLAEGERLLGLEHRELLIRSWLEARVRRQDLLDRMDSLTAREETVLGLLYRGHPVRDIAVMLDVTQATVRSHVKATLRKLGAKSQIDAVALVAWVRDYSMLSIPV